MDFNPINIRSDMNVGYLSEGEINHELGLRNLLYLESGMGERRNILRHTFNEEKKDQIKIPTRPYRDTKAQIEEVSKKLVEIETIIEAYHLSCTEGEKIRIENKFKHLQGRLIRMVSRDQNLSDQITTLRQKLVELNYKFTGARRKHVETTPRLEEIENNEEEDEEEEGANDSVVNATLADMQRQINKLKLSNARLQLQRENDLHTTLSNNDSRTERTRDFRRGRRVAEWAVTFDGDKKSDLIDFLGRVEKFQHTEKTTDEDLFDQAFYLFTGKAKTWFNAFGHRFRSWNEICTELKRVYIKKDHDRIVRKEIESRVQRPSETWFDYFTDMELKFRKLTQPINSHEKLSILQDNLHSDYKEKLVLVEIESVQELDEACLKIESYLAQKSRVSERNRNFFRSSELEHEEQKEVDEKLAAFVRKRSMKDAETQTDINGSNKNASCFNCRKMGHHFKDCTEPRKILCYKCGAHGVYSTNCPRCTTEN
jgi:Retrotransposon gag protein